jgi:hypothetical protein
VKLSSPGHNVWLVRECPHTMPGIVARADVVSDRTTSRNVVPLVAAFWAALVAAYLYWAATYDLSVVYISSDMSRFEILKNRVISYAKVVAVTGPASAFGLTIPALLALFPLVIPKYRPAALVVASVLTLCICLVWPPSIGVLYLPTAVLLLVAEARATT